MFICSENEDFLAQGGGGCLAGGGGACQGGMWVPARGGACQGVCLPGGGACQGGVPARGGACRGGPATGGACWGGVPCDLSHHAFDVTCLLPPHQLRPTNSAAAYIVLVGHVTCKASWDTHPPPL